jgi:uncharacterized coiled-coil DUF342 family protein
MSATAAARLKHVLEQLVELRSKRNELKKRLAERNEKNKKLKQELATVRAECDEATGKAASMRAAIESHRGSMRYAAPEARDLHDERLWEEVTS